MPNFVAVWPDRVSLLVDAEDEAAVTEIATEVGEIAPARVVRLPARALVAEILIDEGGSALLEPLPHVVDVLVAIDDDEAPDAASSSTACGSEAEDDAGELVVCELAPTHAGPHRAGALQWT